MLLFHSVSHTVVDKCKNLRFWQQRRLIFTKTDTFASKPYTGLLYEQILLPVHLHCCTDFKALLLILMHKYWFRLHMQHYYYIFFALSFVQWYKYEHQSVSYFTFSSSFHLSSSHQTPPLLTLGLHSHQTQHCDETLQGCAAGREEGVSLN